MKLKNVLYVVLIVLSVAAAIAGIVYIVDKFLKKREQIKKEYIPCEIAVGEAE